MQMSAPIRWIAIILPITLATFTAHAQEQKEEVPKQLFKVKFPFTANEQYRISQGNCGRFSHNCDEFRYAWDFDMPEGTPVAAAAAGRVVDVKQDGKLGGGSRRFAAYTNYMLLDHGHGHFTRYMHLQFNGAKVKVGEVVKAGQIIALSGATGFATSAHLHFQACDFQGNSEPCAFLDFPMRGGVPQAGDNCSSGADTSAVDKFEGDSTLPDDVFAKNGISLNCTLPSHIYQEGELYQIKGMAPTEIGTKVLMFIMPTNSFETLEQFMGKIGEDGTFEFPVRLTLPRTNGKAASQAFRMTMVVADADGSYQSEVNTPLYITEHKEAAAAPTETAANVSALQPVATAPVQFFSTARP